MGSILSFADRPPIAELDDRATAFHGTTSLDWRPGSACDTMLAEPLGRGNCPPNRGCTWATQRLRLRRRSFWQRSPGAEKSAAGARGRRGNDTKTDPGNGRLTVCQRTYSYRASGRVYPDRHLGPVSEAGGQPLRVPLRRRYPWHGDHDPGAAGRAERGTGHRRNAAAARAGLCRI